VPLFPCGYWDEMNESAGRYCRILDVRGVKVNSPERSRVIRFAEARAGIPTGERSAAVWRRGSLDVAFALPVPPKEQTPHIQDEIYIIIRGRGVLVHDGKRDSFDSGDILFVAAGTEHQFEDVTDDLALWRVFYGPHGGDIRV
jgi:mannose-6-phosphate isomerase-like protein (cupin superfamily)